MPRARRPCRSRTENGGAAWRLSPHRAARTGADGHRLSSAPRDGRRERRSEDPARRACGGRALPTAGFSERRESRVSSQTSTSSPSSTSGRPPAVCTSLHATCAVSPSPSGSLLKERFRSRRRSAWSSHLAGALEALHARDLVHRDVKPANVMVDERGAAALTDFGLARGTADTVLTKTGVVVGTVDYLAPELIRGQQADRSSDVYALGCLLYECLAGAPPFADKAVRGDAPRPRPGRTARSERPPGGSARQRFLDRPEGTREGSGAEAADGDRLRAHVARVSAGGLARRAARRARPRCARLRLRCARPPPRPARPLPRAAVPERPALPRRGSS